MDPKVIGNYGGPKVDATVQSNPETQVAASELNRAYEDLAQSTITATRAIVQFLTRAEAAPFVLPAAAVTVRTVWGSGPAQKPTVTKSATGVYDLVFPTTFTDSLTVIETVAFFDGWTSVRVANNTDVLDARITSIASNLVSAVTYSPHGTLADAGNVSAAAFSLAVFLR